MGLAGSPLSGSIFALSSSDMPFLKALMPDAKSPISSEILPRPPNSSRTATITSSQCIQLKEPIAFSSAGFGHAARDHPRLSSWKLGFGDGKNKDFGRFAAVFAPSFGLQ